MTEVTITELSVTDLPFNNRYGTAKRRALVALRFFGSSTDTLDLSSYVPGIADIEGVMWNSIGSVKGTSYPTWSTYTLTAANCTTSTGSAEVGLIVNFS